MTVPSRSNTPGRWFARVLPQVPWTLLAVVAALLVVGLAGIARCVELGLAADVLAARQAVWSVIALVVMLVSAAPNYRSVQRFSYVLFTLSLVLLAAVYLFPPINGARRWIRFGPLGVQPSELAKVAYVLALSRWVMYRDNYRRLRGMAVPLVLTFVPLLLILKEPDLGTAAVFLPVLFVMLFTAGARKRDLAVLAAAALAAMPLVWTQMSTEQRSRITAWFDQQPPGVRPSADGFHLHQAKQMFALGGATGSLWAGEAVDDRSVYFVPEAATDSILAVLAERYGLVGVGVVLALFAVLAGRGLAIAAATREPFGRMAAVGLTTLLAVPAAINAGMMVGLVPITGLSLPLVSYGGSGLVGAGLAVGLLVNIALRPGYEMNNEPFRPA